MAREGRERGGGGRKDEEGKGEGDRVSEGRAALPDTHEKRAAVRERLLIQAVGVKGRAAAVGGWRGERSLQK